MSFLLNEPTTFINIKLTDDGRRMLSLGQLEFSKAVFSDREVNYGFDRPDYDIENNVILGPKDYHPNFTINLDGTSAITLSQAQVGSTKQIITASTTDAGFFTGNTNSFYYDLTQSIGTAKIQYSAFTPNGTSEIEVFSGSSYFPSGGELIYIPWQPIQNSGFTSSSTSTVPSGNSTVGLWYRVFSADSSSYTIGLDRPVPHFGFTGASTNQEVDIYFYPFSGVGSYYGSASTIETKVWNMNIVRTSSVPGTSSSISGYTTYGSVEYNGFKTYLGFSSDTREVGIIHYTNKWTGNTYAEQLVEGTVVLDIPNVMWHKYSANLGEAVGYGVRLYDSYGSYIYDSAAQTTYKYLRDGTSSSSNIVGRVYHKLKLFVITDSELLTAISYKSNRNYTLPEPVVGLSTVPKYPLTTSDATGLTNSGYTYFVTYATESDSIYTSGSSFGYPNSLPCSYIQKIEGQVDAQGNPQYLTVSFPSNSFPYLRKSANMEPSSSFSGTGWNSNKFQIYVNEQLTSSGYEIDTVPADEWIKISDGIGNGIYTGDTSDLTIDPLKLSAYQFVISREDYTSGVTYTLNSDLYNRNNIDTNGLTFGSESFFFGKVKTDILATVFKTTITTYATNTQFNSSSNGTFDSLSDSTIYITEIGILDSNNTLVAVGKPTRPLRKDSGRYLTFQLELDF